LAKIVSAIESLERSSNSPVQLNMVSQEHFIDGIRRAGDLGKVNPMLKTGM